MLYELLVRGTLAGTISGAHAIDFVDGKPGLPRPMTPEDWTGIAAEINAAAVATATAKEATAAATEADVAARVKAALLDAQAKYDAFVKRGEAALAASDLVAFAVILGEAATITSEARAAEIEHKRSELQAQLAALNA